MARSETDAPTVELGWDELAPGGEVSATVLMAAGFVLTEGQVVRERYRVERVVGEGAMGQVLAVTLVGSADRQTYALKVVARPADGNVDGVVDERERAEAELHARWFARFLRAEALKQDVAQRNGVSVARLFALVQLDDGSIGLRMELARGRSLEAVVQDGYARAGEAPDAAAALTIVRKLLSQLRRLHELADEGSPKGFIHSDIKPGNVFVDDADPTDLLVTLLDFGVATAGQALESERISQHGSRKTFVLQQTGGTPGYVPPQHFGGKATPLSDVYAAVVILFELVALEPPWELRGIVPSAETLPALEAAMLAGPRAVAAVRPSVPAPVARELDAFFAREFAELHALAARAARAREAPDSDEARALASQLRRLAREYQSRLDALRVRLDPTARPGSVPAPPLPAERPEPIPAPPPPAPRARPTRASWLLAALAALAAPLAATGAFFAARARAAPPPRPPTVPASTLASASAPLAPPLAPPPAPAATGISVDALRNAPTIEPPAPLRTTAPAHAHSAHGTPDAGAAVAGVERCACVAAVSGARVVARGGALAHEVTLCTAEAPLEQGRAEYFGRGSIAPEVFGALPTFACLADGAELELTVQRYGTASGTELLLQCRRSETAPAPAPAASPPPAPPAAPPTPTAPPAPPVSADAEAPALPEHDAPDAASPSLEDDVPPAPSAVPTSPPAADAGSPELDASSPVLQSASSPAPADAAPALPAPATAP